MNARTLSASERANTAYWAAGHALVASLLDTGPVARVTIVPAEGYMGYVLCSPKSDAFAFTRDEMFNQLVFTMAGLAAADEFTPDDVTTGCSNDFERAVALATRISEINGEEVITVLTDARARGRKLLADNRDSVEAVAQALLAQPTLSGEEFAKVVAGVIH